MVLKMTREQRARARHRATDADGDCTRCGLKPCEGARDDYCPPGFWMTEQEIADWVRGVRVA